MKYNNKNTTCTTYCRKGLWRWRILQDDDIIGAGDLSFKFQDDALMDMEFLLDNRWIFPDLMYYEDAVGDWRWRITADKDTLYSSHQGWKDKEQCMYNAKYLATSEWDCN